MAQQPPTQVWAPGPGWRLVFTILAILLFLLAALAYSRPVAGLVPGSLLASGLVALAARGVF